jgi:hypothetical protein
MGNAPFHMVAEIKQIDPQKYKGLAGYPGPFLEEGDNNMLRQEFAGIKTPDFFLGVDGDDTVYPLR